MFLLSGQLNDGIYAIVDYSQAIRDDDMEQRRKPRTEEQKEARRLAAEKTIPAELHAKAERLAGALLRPRAEVEGPTAKTA